MYLIRHTILSNITLRHKLKQGNNAIIAVLHFSHSRVFIKEHSLRVFNATLNNISVISWRSVLLVEETGVPRENHRPSESHWQTSIT